MGRVVELAPRQLSRFAAERAARVRAAVQQCRTATDACAIVEAERLALDVNAVLETAKLYGDRAGDLAARHDALASAYEEVLREPVLQELSTDDLAAAAVQVLVTGGHAEATMPEWVTADQRCAVVLQLLSTAAPVRVARAMVYSIREKFGTSAEVDEIVARTATEHMLIAAAIRATIAEERRDASATVGAGE